MLLLDVLSLLPYYAYGQYSNTICRESHGWILHHLALLSVRELDDG